MADPIRQPDGAANLDPVGTGDDAPLEPAIVGVSSEDAGAAFVVGDPGLAASVDSGSATGPGAPAKPLLPVQSSGDAGGSPLQLGGSTAGGGVVAGGDTSPILGFDGLAPASTSVANLDPVGTGDGNSTDGDTGAGFHPPGPPAAPSVDAGGSSALGSDAGTGGVTTQTVSVAGSGLVFNNTYEPGVSAAFQANIVTAETDLASLWTNSVTLNLDFQAVDQGNNGDLAFNSWPTFVDVTYVQLKGALSSHASSSYAQAAVAALPATDPNPAGGSDWALPEAYARMLGLSSSTPTFDDTITLNTFYNWNFGQDVVNTIEHEISEGGMGRVGGLGDQNSVWSTMDLFRYVAAGVPDYTDGRDSLTTYFSYDGGTTLSSAVGLSYNNQYSGSTKQNGGDTADFSQQDVFGTGSTAETNTLSLTDMEVMDVLGWSPACYCRGTLIRTERGEVAVEVLAIGDQVVILSGEARPIKWIGHRAYDGRFVARNRGVLPIRIEAGALAEGIPTRDLWVSPEHALYIDGVLVPAGLLVNGATIRQVERIDRLEYFHIELDSHDVILAEGAPAETFVDCDNHLLFHNGAEFARLYPGDMRPAWAFCAPRLDEASAELPAIRAALLEHGEALGDRLTDEPWDDGEAGANLG